MNFIKRFIVKIVVEDIRRHGLILQELKNLGFETKSYF